MSSDHNNSNSSNSHPPALPEFELQDLERVALRGLAARQSLLQREIEKICEEIDMDRAIIYGSIEARLGLAAGAILMGVYRIEGNAMLICNLEKREETAQTGDTNPQDGSVGSLLNRSLNDSE